MIRPILQLGDENLYATSLPVGEGENVDAIVDDLHDTLLDWQTKNNAGRALAAPQIGVGKRIIYMHIDEPVVFINPRLEFPTSGMTELWEDCMSLPGLYVRVRRYQECRIHFIDMERKERVFYLQGSLSELIQHEYDYLEGVLATMRAADSKAFSLLKR